MATLAALRGAITAAVAQVNWPERATELWNWTRGAAGDTWVFLSGLPANCWLASVHAGMVCMGQNPSYHSVPGFGPFSLAWGWMLVGIVVGAAAMYIYMFHHGRLRRQSIRSINQPPSIPQMSAADSEREEFLEYIALAGRPALQDLAARTGSTEADILIGLFGAQPSIATSPLSNSTPYIATREPMNPFSSPATNSTSRPPYHI